MCMRRVHVLFLSKKASDDMELTYACFTNVNQDWHDVSHGTLVEAAITVFPAIRTAIHRKRGSLIF